VEKIHKLFSKWFEGINPVLGCLLLPSDEWSTEEKRKLLLGKSVQTQSLPLQCLAVTHRQDTLFPTLLVSPPLRWSKNFQNA
jgi:hypothetical protein